MDSAKWKRKIKKACRDAGTYRPYFDSVVDTLAGIMELRDSALQQFLESGGAAVVEHTNKNGATNTVKNPALVAVMDCNAQALQYWMQLGLTAKGYKAVFGDMAPQDEKKGFAEVLGELGL